LGGISIGNHDNSEASRSDNEWASKGALCVLNMKNYYSTFTELLTRTDAVIRDPCISFNGKKVLFAMSGKGKVTEYKIYEMEIADTSTLKQLTFDPSGLPVVADFEPCYLPNGDIMLTSIRNFGMTADAFNPTTNMFLMNGEGNYMRQVGFDHAHTFYPVLMDSGIVLYTRWEYNDRVGIFTIRDVYLGAGMKGIESSDHLAQKIRVVKLRYRIGGGGPVWRCDYGFFTIRRLCTRNFLPGFRIWRFMGCKGSLG
jgi:hypothetical protein